MIPQSLKEIISNGGNVGLFQTLAMLLFMLLFVVLVWYVFSRPKKHYEEEANAPLGEDHPENQFKFKK